MDLNSLKSEKEALIQALTEKKKAIDTISSNPMVQQFIQLSEERTQVELNIKKLSDTILVEHFKSCKHIKAHYIYSQDRDGKEYLHYCIKCKLDEYSQVLNSNYCSERDSLMRKVLNTNGFPGKNLNITCDPDWGYALTAELLKNYPTCSDEELAVLFQTQIKHLREDNTFYSQKQKQFKLNYPFC